MHLMQVDSRNRKIYDPKNRPAQLANQSREIVERILGESESNNYHRAKAIAQIGKSELVQKNQEKAEQLFLEAQTVISACFGSDHPLVAKYNQNLVEAYNLKPESNERTL